jgi:hypothetical protein
MAPVQLEDPAGHVVQEIPVVGDRHYRAGVGVQVLLQPGDALRVQVVGRLIQQQQVRLGQQQPAQRHPAPLAAGQHGHLRVRGRASQRVHRLVDPAVQVPGVPVVQLLLQPAQLIQQVIGVVRGHLRRDLVVPLDQGPGLSDALLDVAEHRPALVQGGFLRQDAYAVAGLQPDQAVGRLLESSHHAQQRGFAHAVRPDHADLRSGQERQRDVVEDDLAVIRLAGVAESQNLIHAACVPSLPSRDCWHWRFYGEPLRRLQRTRFAR